MEAQTAPLTVTLMGALTGVTTGVPAGALTIPDVYAVPLVVVCVSGLITLVAWLYRQVTETSRFLAVTATALEEFRHDTDRRLERLEGWRDGVQFATAHAQVADRLSGRDSGPAAERSE